jgi:hypothetical protein
MPQLVALALLLLQTPPRDTQVVYRNDAYGFQLAVPDQWIQVPDSIFQARIQFVRQNGATESQTNYVAAFAHDPVQGWFAYPYVMIQVEPLDPDDPSPPTLDTIAAALNGVVPEATGNRLITKAPPAGTARVDRKMAAVLYQGGRTQVSGSGWLLGYSGIKLTPRGLVSVNAYGMESDSLATAAIRDRFLAGLQVDRPPHGP